MRADRLLSILLFLQHKGRMTAQELASELEVSIRTIYRDVNALSVAGVPVYTERGPGGGINLVENYRSDLTGLSNEEVRALFMLDIPTAVLELGQDKNLKAAMIKLAAALPDNLRGDERRITQLVLIDPKPWILSSDSVPRSNLQNLQKALWESLEIEVHHKIIVPVGEETIGSILCPLGLISKENKWFLVSRRDDHINVLDVDRIKDIVFTGEFFSRPDSFNLKEFWDGWCLEVQQNRPSYPVMVEISPALVDYFSNYFQQDFIFLNSKDKAGWIKSRITFNNFEQARSKLLAFGGDLKVLAPVALRHSMKDFSAQILSRYPEVES